MNESVLITGGNGILGQSVCNKFLEKGYWVTTIVRPGDDLNFISHNNLQVVALDLSNGTETEGSLRQIINKYGPYTFAVFTVGGFAIGRIHETGLDNIRKMIQLNFETAYSSSRVLFQHFKEQGISGRMILIGARPGLNPGEAKEMVAYGLSKSLVFSLADIINTSGREIGIDASVIVPSIIDTPSNRRGMPDADFNKWVKPDHLAENIYFLSTPAGRKQKNVVFKVYGDS